ncbi:MAG: 1-(5-phosphoribosyl)-5-amino-4-imidazole-carboxylate carboxylase [Verrucomicrobiaceae bacterium]|nr:1-(5-phosphoribosyl)-5-amino-4-imidazole-carboxylate carboxylase [Verrucomicrobiaceae bacterium]
MSPERLEKLLEQVAAGDLSARDAVEQLRELPFTELSHTTLDTHRELRQGAPETVYGAGKSAEQLIEILSVLVQTHQRALATRVNRRKARHVLEALPEARYNSLSRLLTVGERPVPPAQPHAVVACAGTSDLPVAEEASQTLEFLGHRVERITDVGVAGIHRLFSKLDKLRSAQVILSVAGMEGALTSVIGGLVSAPVIGVPTNVGYGVSRGGETALHAMLSSCASGVAVVNIDNGFGAAMVAHSILRGSNS